MAVWFRDAARPELLVGEKSVRREMGEPAATMDSTHILFFSSSFSFFLSFFLSVCFCCCKFLVGQMAVCWKGWEAPVVVGCQDVEDKSGLLSSTERSQ